jgi:5-methylcytosine-specific restriction endonuclease McrA
LSSSYSELLLDTRWDEKRVRILKRDDYTCIGCGATKLTLHVHHLIYIKGRHPWQYRDGDLLTLCIPCHENEHSFDGSNPHSERGARALEYRPKPQQIMEVVAGIFGVTPP